MERERVDVGVIGAEVDAVAGERDRALDQAACMEVPAQVAGRGGEGIDVVGPIADDDEPVGEERRALRRPDRPLPADPARFRVEGDYLAVDAVGGVARRSVQ